MEAVYQWMKNIVYFLLLVGVIRNLTSKEYQKYTGLTVGLCLVLLVASPLMKYVSEDNFLFFLRMNELDDELAWKEISADETEWKESVLAEYGILVREQAGALLKDMGLIVTRVEFQLEEDRVITGLTVWVSRKAAEQSNGYKAVETISITDIVVSLDSEEEEELQQDSLELQILKLAIKTELADFYDMDASHIYVIIS